MADTPFGLSFGNPSKYMGQSPLAQIGKDAKTFLALQGLQKSGVIDYLNQLGGKKEGVAPARAVAPTAPAMSAPVAPPAATVAPMAPVSPQPPTTVEPQQQTAPEGLGLKILDGDDSWQKDSFVNPKSDNDFNPLAMQGEQQERLTGNEYQKTPGYGNLAKVASFMFGIG